MQPTRQTDSWVAPLHLTGERSRIEKKLESCHFVSFLVWISAFWRTAILEKNLKKGKKIGMIQKTLKKSNVLVLLLDEVQQIQI